MGHVKIYGMSDVETWLSTVIHKNTCIDEYPYRGWAFTAWMPIQLPIHDKVLDAHPTISQEFLWVLYQECEPYDVEEHIVSMK